MWLVKPVSPEVVQKSNLRKVPRAHTPPWAGFTGQIWGRVRLDSFLKTCVRGESGELSAYLTDTLQKLSNWISAKHSILSPYASLLKEPAFA